LFAEDKTLGVYQSTAKSNPFALLTSCQTTEPLSAVFCDHDVPFEEASKPPDDPPFSLTPIKPEPA
jgi:hypothetical protein